MKKLKSIIMMAAMALVGFSSCNEDLAMPPMNLPEGGIGSGAWDSPMTVYQVNLGAVNSEFATPWVKGYIVGFINTGVGNVLNNATAAFTADGAVKSNILLAGNPDEKDWKNCISVQLPSGAVRTALSLGDKPGNLGKLVCIQGTTGDKYCGVYGIRSASAYNFGETGTEGTGGGTPTPTPDPTPDPTPAGTTIYEALPTSATTIDWTLNADASGAVTTPWSWKTYNGKSYLNASSYAGSAQESQANAYSPAISLEGYKKVTMTFDHAAKFQTTLTTLCWVIVREVGTTTWDKLTIPAWPTAGAWTFSSAGNIDLTKYAGKKVEVGFHYGGTAEGADTWEINNVKITGEK